MVWTSTNLFKGVSCPAGESCDLINCVFSHEHVKKDSTGAHSGSNQTKKAQELPSKKQKLSHSPNDARSTAKADQLRAQIVSSKQNAVQKSAAPEQESPKSLTRSISPPSLISTLVKKSVNHNESTSKSGSVKTQSKPTKVEKLNPRMLNPSPDTHAHRMLYLQHIHNEFRRLNNLCKSRQDGTKNTTTNTAKILSDQECVDLALDEEEDIARKHFRTYSHKVRHFIVRYKKMTIEEWLAKLNQNNEQTAQHEVKQLKSIKTGLSSAEEVLLLPHLVIQDQVALEKHGYIPSPPDAAAIVEAAAAVEVSKNYEQCERCGSRFQIFPNRDPETGRLTSNGPCVYHWRRKAFPTRQKTDAYTGNNEPFYPCCGQAVGSTGCEENENHVFKTTSPARLAAVLPFICTPENKNPRKDINGKTVQAVVFDCEMGYTTLGLELIRLTALSWPEGIQLVDVLVRPYGTIIDLNTRFSGVKAEHLVNAPPYDLEKPNQSLSIVQNPAIARELLCEYLTPQISLIGHAVDNDLNATRLCHPTIIDTIMLYPHPKGLPMRFGLKMLSEKYLNRVIQSAGSNGHDSYEDARATGDLVRVEAGERWKDMKAKGWTICGYQLLRPTSNTDEELASKKRKRAEPEKYGVSLDTTTR